MREDELKFGKTYTLNCIVCGRAFVVVKRAGPMPQRQSEVSDPGATRGLRGE